MFAFRDDIGFEQKEIQTEVKFTNKHGTGIGIQGSWSKEQKTISNFPCLLQKKLMNLTI